MELAHARPANLPPADKIRLLLIDDNRTLAETMAETLAGSGYDCEVATTSAEGARKIDSEAFDVVLTDLRLDGADGLALLRRAKQLSVEPEVIVITGHGDVKTAVEAMQHGAFSFLEKGPNMTGALRAQVKKAVDHLRLNRANTELKRQLDEKFGFEGVVGNTPRMHDMIAQLRAVAPTSVTALILGENGTGKELVARALHYNSPRAKKNFVAMNCTALNENLLEDELFGHEPGAFTGADKLRKGRFEHAHGGTLFLDEVGDMPPSLQAKLLRVLEDQQVFRIGSNDPIQVNVRLISATNRDLEAAVKKGEFRQDLYFRLKVVTIKLPPLRERIKDVPLLAATFIEDFNKRHEKNVSRTPAEPLRRAMEGYDWPGNVRELRNLIESMVVLDQDGVLSLDDLQEGDGLRQKLPELGPTNPAGLVGRPLAEVERYFVEKTLELCGGNREEAARRLVIGERTLYRMMQDWKDQDKAREALAASAGDVEEAAKVLNVSGPTLERKLKKWGLQP